MRKYLKRFIVAHKCMKLFHIATSSTEEHNNYPVIKKEKGRTRPKWEHHRPVHFISTCHICHLSLAHTVLLLWKDNRAQTLEYSLKGGGCGSAKKLYKVHTNSSTLSLYILFLQQVLQLSEFILSHSILFLHGVLCLFALLFLKSVALLFASRWWFSLNNRLHW